MEAIGITIPVLASVRRALALVELAARIANPQTPAALAAIQYYITTLIELQALLADLSDQAEVNAASIKVFEINTELSKILRDISQLGGVPERFFSIKKIRLMRAMGQGLPRIRTPLMALQDQIAEIWSRQSDQARRAIAYNEHAAAQQRNLGAYEKAAVDALLGQYVEVASVNIEASQACLLSARRLIYGMPSGTEEDDEQHAATTSEIENSQRVAVHKRLLGLLQYSSMGMRQSSVSAPCESSCQWIYEKSRDVDTWYSLPEWLERKSGLYLIEGQAGSGKSTLMRYIWETRMAKLPLAEWAKGDGSALLSASFFFWRNGTRLEKSAEGLWRGLMFKVLDQAPELLPSIFPKEWALLYAGALVPSLGSWSVAELEQAFERLCSQKQKKIKLFLLIDGLDEHAERETDFSNCVEFLANRLAPLSDVRIVLSSRPITNLAQLRLHPAASVQNHTHTDIESYVAKTLLENAAMWEEAADDEGHTRETIQKSILDASEGVFLAAILLTRYVNNVLASGTTNLGDVERQLAQPKEPKDMYRLVWGTLDAEVQVEALKVIFIMLAREGIHRSLHGEDRTIRLIDITLALGEHPNFERPWRAVQPLVERNCLKVAKAFTETWPGFITITHQGDGRDAWTGDGHDAAAIVVSSASLVDYCHRSVPEFFENLFLRLSAREPLNGAAAAVPGTIPPHELLLPLPGSFCPRKAQLKSLVYQLTILPQPCPRDHLQTLWSFATMALVAANHVERYGRVDEQYLDLVDQLDRTMTFHHKRLQQGFGPDFLPTTIRDSRGTMAISDYGRDSRRRAQLHWASFHSEAQWAHPRSWHDSFTGIAVHYGLRDYLARRHLGRYLRQHLRRHLGRYLESDGKVGAGMLLSPLGRRGGGRPLLSYALAPRLPLATVAPYDLVSVELVELLLRNSSRPNRRFTEGGGVTCWQEGLVWLHDTFAVQAGHAVSAAGGTSEDIRAVAETRADICLLLLRAGADPKATIEVGLAQTTPMRTTTWRTFPVAIDGLGEMRNKTTCTLTAKEVLAAAFAGKVSGDKLRILLTEVDERVAASKRKPHFRRRPDQ